MAEYAKGNKRISYDYDVDGMRYKKEVYVDNTETARYDYVYSDGTLILLTYTANGVANTARFVYDSFGEPRGFILNNSATYLYLKNGQGDITAIVGETGEILVRYEYNAWGAVEFVVPFGVDPAVTSKLATVSPFTYRGYCYDYDIGMYYLQSRYYDPQICRFINADSTDYLGATDTVLSYNLFAYCENDGVNNVDPKGTNRFTLRSGFYDIRKHFDKYHSEDAFHYNPKAKITLKDKLNWKVWGGLRLAASLFFPQGAAFYEYYRSKEGGTYIYDYELAYKQDSGIKYYVNKAVNYIKKNITRIVKKPNKNYDISASCMRVICETMNWKLALGLHIIGIHASVIYNSKTSKFEMSYVVMAFDRYNFDGENKNFYGIPDAYNGRCYKWQTTNLIRAY